MDKLVIKLEKAEDFDKIISTSDLPVMVDFYADWCGPCVKLAPELIKRAEETKKFRLIKVNVDDFPELSDKFQVSGIPHVVLFKQGKQAGSFTGINIKVLEEWISSF